MQSHPGHIRVRQPDRLPAEELARLRKSLADRNVRLQEGPEFEEKLSHLRTMYEPYSESIALRLLITLPPWVHTEKKKDNWEAGPWDRAIQATKPGHSGTREPTAPEGG